MAHLGLKPELRDGTTIRAYLDELVIKKTPVQLWIPQEDAPPFETTIIRVARDTFTTAQTPPLAENQALNVCFMVDARRLIAPTQVVSTGVFRIPTSVAMGERRERFRATFSRADGIDGFACEWVGGTFLAGRALTGHLLDLSLQGMRMSLDQVERLDALPAQPPARGDAFGAVSISGLPFTPVIRCGGIVAHVQERPEGSSAGFLLTGLSDRDQKNIERILARRFPTTFGQAFPKKHRKTDLADQPGPPVLAHEPPKAPEVVAPVLPAPAPEPQRRPRPEVTPVLRIRMASRKILVISAGTEDGLSLAQHLREDDFRQVFEARSYLEALNLARTTEFDIVILDVKVGGHYGQMILETIRRNGMLQDAQVILVADRRDASVETVAEAVGAVYVHEKRAPYEDILPALFALLND